MALEKTLQVGGKPVRFRCSAGVPRLYRIKFHRDIMQDIQVVGEALKGKQQQGTQLPIEALELFENLAYIMAKHADPQGVPGEPDEWLEQFDFLSIYEVFPALADLWAENVHALPIAKKKRGRSTGKSRRHS